MSGVGAVGAGGYAALVQRLAAQRATQNTQTSTTAQTGSTKAFDLQSTQGVNDLTTQATSSAMAPRSANSVSAGNRVDGLLSGVKDAQADADKMVIDLASGRDVNIHNTMVELEKADIALKYTVQLRNRALSAYEELMRMQV